MAWFLVINKTYGPVVKTRMSNSVFYKESYRGSSDSWECQELFQMTMWIYPWETWAHLVGIRPVSEEWEVLQEDVLLIELGGKEQKSQQ